MSIIVQGGQKATLPGAVVLNHPEAFEIWTLYRAFGRRFLPSQLLNEPASWLDDMLALENLFEALRPDQA